MIGSKKRRLLQAGCGLLAVLLPGFLGVATAGPADDGGLSLVAVGMELGPLWNSDANLAEEYGEGRAWGLSGTLLRYGKHDGFYFGLMQHSRDSRDTRRDFSRLLLRLGLLLCAPIGGHAAMYGGGGLSLINADFYGADGLSIESGHGVGFHLTAGAIAYIPMLGISVRVVRDFKKGESGVDLGGTELTIGLQWAVPRMD